MSDKIVMFIPTVPARETTATYTAAKGDLAARGSNQDIRRPLDALTLADDSYATISLLSGGSLHNTSVASGRSSTNANLLIQSLSYSIAEKHQRAQTFDRDRLFFFGQTLATLRIDARTLDTLTFQWLQELHENYATRIGGSIAAERGAKVQITSEGRVYTGYILDMSFAKNASDRYTANVNFSMALTSLKHLKRLRSTVDEKDLGQLSVEQAFPEISKLLASSRGGSADTDAPLASQLDTLIYSELKPVTEGTYAFKDIYLNEYPNRSYGFLTGNSFVSKEETVERVKMPDELAEQLEGSFDDVFDYYVDYGAGVTTAPIGTDGSDISTLESTYTNPVPALRPNTPGEQLPTGDDSVSLAASVGGNLSPITSFGI